MKLDIYPSQRHYVKAQRRSNRRKSGRSGASADEVAKIADYMKIKEIEPGRGLCHGAGLGVEVKLFQVEFPLAEVQGTDLFKRNPDFMVQWDFHEPKPEWMGAFDFIYSNSLDHSHSPQECIHIWLDQLKPTGLLFVMWCFAQVGTQVGDCFGANLHEYITIMERKGTVRDLIYCNGGSLKTIVVVGRKEE